jgi:cyclophilin family peptidyl-prolyl cis-trans isomerase
VPGGEFAFRKPPQVAWKDDMSALGTADFRSTKAAILWSALTADDGRGLLAVSDGRHATRAFLDKDRVGFLVADFNTGGGDMFYAGHHKAFDRPIEKGGAIKGAFEIRLVAPAPPAAYPDGLYAEVATNKGLIVLALEFEKTPMTVASYVGLAEGKIRNAALPDGTPFFDGTAWHRVVPGHVIQCGIPANGKAQGPGYQFPNEIRLPDLNHGRAGMVTMANGGPHTNASQWCITLGDRSYLDGDYTVFGHVVKGMDVVMAIAQGDAVRSVRIVRVGAAAQTFRPTTDSFLKMVEAARLRVKAEDEKKAADEASMVAKSWPGALPAAGGVTYILTHDGTGRALAPGDKVKVAYSGRTLYGKTFVSTAPDGKPYWGETPEAFVFEIGKSVISPGLDAAIAAMKPGERRTVIVPAEAGYRTSGYYAPQRPGEKRFAISPNTLLVYDVEVLAIAD